jgi:hypothetical protein
MESILVKGIRFHKLDSDNEIEIERDGWSSWISITETEILVEFLTEQIAKAQELTFKSE